MNELNSSNILGKSIIHDSSLRQCTGEAEYIDDINSPQNTLHAALVLSPFASGKIKCIKMNKAKSLDGVVDILTADDIPGKNCVGPIIKNEPALAEKYLEYVGQPVAVVVAVSHNIACQAASIVKIKVSDEVKPIFDLEEAKKLNSFVLPKMTLSRGNSEDKIKHSKHSLKGELLIGGQDHFYLEGQISIAIPEEDQQMTIWSSTQHPTEVQHCVSHILDIPFASITSKVRRLGGGFGGKESQASIIASIAALCAWKIKQPVKLRLPRNQDMLATGKRHDFLMQYEVGYDNRGKINGLNIELLSRAGNVADLSGPVMTRAITHIDNTYSLKNIKITGYICKTNTVSNTAFRGFGGPQGIISIESIIDDISKTLKLSNEEVRLQNCYSVKNGLTTPYLQRVNECDKFHIVFEQVSKLSNYPARKKNIQKFNENQKDIGSPLRKGLASNVVKFGISFNKTELNQAGALVHVYTDGSVRLGHGGTEMGQGLFIKVAQVVAEVFSIPLNRIILSSTTTSEVPNTSATAASAGSDLNGMAAYNASITIKNRMKKVAAEHFETSLNQIIFKDGFIKSGNKSISFEELAQLTWAKRVSLSSTGYYKTPQINWDQEKMVGNPYFYFTWGASISEAIIDTFTGENRILRSDIVQDCGKSLNPNIDIGQIEGAFVQGLGWLTCEELYWNKEGRLMTIGPSTYKIPGSRDVPQILNVKLLENTPNIRNTIFRSKAVGEPPLMLSISCWLALKDAISNFRGGGKVNLNVPATPENILNAINE